MMLTVRDYIQLDEVYRNYFKLGLHPDTVSSLIGVHLNSVFNCCKQSNFEPSILDGAKLCTREKNMNYKHSVTSEIAITCQYLNV